MWILFEFTPTSQNIAMNVFKIVRLHLGLQARFCETMSSIFLLAFPLFDHIYESYTFKILIELGM